MFRDCTVSDEKTFPPAPPIQWWRKASKVELAWDSFLSRRKKSRVFAIPWPSKFSFEIPPSSLDGGSGGERFFRRWLYKRRDKKNVLQKIKLALLLLSKMHKILRVHFFLIACVLVNKQKTKTKCTTRKLGHIFFPMASRTALYFPFCRTLHLNELNCSKVQIVATKSWKMFKKHA